MFTSTYSLAKKDKIFWLNLNVTELSRRETIQEYSSVPHIRNNVVNLRSDLFLHKVI